MQYHQKNHFIPFAVNGCLEIIKTYCPNLNCKNIVIVGSSLLVGTPLGFLLKHLGATVTLCNYNTKMLERFTLNADILIVAIGRPEFIKGYMIKPGSIVIDVGANVVPNSELVKRTVVGDIEFESVNVN